MDPPLLSIVLCWRSSRPSIPSIHVPPTCICRRVLAVRSPHVGYSIFSYKHRPKTVSLYSAVLCFKSHQYYGVKDKKNISWLCISGHVQRGAKSDILIFQSPLSLDALYLQFLFTRVGVIIFIKWRPSSSADANKSDFVRINCRPDFVAMVGERCLIHNLRVEKHGFRKNYENIFKWMSTFNCEQLIANAVVQTV